MTLRLYNTLSRSKEDFVPLDPANVRMYVCGPTVYDFAHIGNARPVIVFDVLFRLLRHMYGDTHVTYVRNITDIDDKIVARAQEIRDGRAILDVVRELTTETGRVYREDVTALGCLAPTHEPRATEYVPRMIGMIETLIATGHAYVAEDHVLFDVSSQAGYGKLAHRALDDMIAGARVDVAPYKRGPMDFVLWKPSDAALPGWPSPWGRGRPGWHIECSAMGEALLGDTFDIHGGGIDLVFPHHENEIAQSESAHADRPLAQVWMHNGFLDAEGEKMSKSLGNFVTIRELLADWPGDVLRFNMLRTHYRQPIDWTLQGMKESLSILERWYAAPEPVAAPRIGAELREALLDDINTPQAIVALHRADPQDLAGGLALLGFSPDPGRLALAPPLPVADITKAIAARNDARKSRNFREADRIRDELAAKGIRLTDNPDGTTGWDVRR
ncbi:MAG: cysteine--tRNA ligase [Rhizomicrobium sp.]